MLMQFRLGYDLGLVLSKSIVCSLITVFLLMPGLIAYCRKPLRVTAHRSHIPQLYGWGRFLMKTKLGCDFPCHPPDGRVLLVENGVRFLGQQH